MFDFNEVQINSAIKNLEQFIQQAQAESPLSLLDCLKSGVESVDFFKEASVSDENKAYYFLRGVSHHGNAFFGFDEMSYKAIFFSKEEIVAMLKGDPKQVSDLIQAYNDIKGFIEKAA